MQIPTLDKLWQTMIHINPLCPWLLFLRISYEFVFLLVLGLNKQSIFNFVIKPFEYQSILKKWTLIIIWTHAHSPPKLKKFLNKLLIKLIWIKN